MITKSRFLQGAQCEKLFSLSKKMPHLLSQNDDLQAFMFQQGNTIGNLAKQLFSDGVEVNENKFMDQIYKTKQLIKNNTPIFEGSFFINNLFCRVDILEFSDTGWHIIEVKSSTSVKPIHILDISFQYYLLNLLDIPISSCNVMVLNQHYKRSGSIDLNSLFRFENVTEKVIQSIPHVEQTIFNLLKLDKQKHIPDIPIGKYCNLPYRCPLHDYCWDLVPKPSIFDIRHLSLDNKFSFYYKNEFLIDDLDIDNFSKKIQKIQIAAFNEGLDYIDKYALRNFLNSLNYPLSFLDFECFQMAVPLYSNIRTYQQVPFQFSLYVLDKKNELTFESFIHEQKSDPRESFLDHLLNVIPNEGSIIVFNKDLEFIILNQLSDLFPDYKNQLLSIKSRIIDLSDIFSKNYIYLREMKGDFSLKSILKAFDASQSFSMLAIDDGFLANKYYHDFLNGESISDKIDVLKEYSRMDVYAMVIILRKIKEFIN